MAKLPASLRHLQEDQVTRFLYWIKERHNVYLRRKRGDHHPWSEDETMNRVFFTNPYRENDRVTAWFRENLRDPNKNNPSILFITLLFRRFNYIPTAQALVDHGLYVEWNTDLAINVIKNEVGTPFTSGAYMMSSPKGTDKCVYFCELMGDIWYTHYDELLAGFEEAESLQEAHALLTPFPTWGPFQAYEIVTDLRYTYLLKDAIDTDLWCMPGPGAKRGYSRLVHGHPNDKSPKMANFLRDTVGLLNLARKRMPKMPHMELRVIEHSLCEYDKYMRVEEGGRPKRWYEPTGREVT